MVGSPNQECPIGAMPKTAQQEDDERVPDNLRLGASASPHRDVNVIPEPGRQ